MAFALRPYQPPDRRALIEAINRVCAEGMMRTPCFEPTPAWEHALNRPDCRCHFLLVATEGSRIVGWCRLFPTGEGTLELGIGVVAFYRYQGIGSALVKVALDWASDQGMPVILETRTDNLPAIRLFIRFGFRTIGQTNGHWRMCYP
ncbi:MAG: GNAT family N-acetyltransferase [Anaerolineae bacterium]|nr:GNAT family N-acetyltransferase [Anaerolineae bacterium]